MNTIYSGSFTKDGLVYDYCGIWKPLVTGVEWKAVVRNADVVCRPCGVLEDERMEEEILLIIRQLIELSVEEALERKFRAA